MSLFCLLCIPLFYLLRRAVFPGKCHSKWALPLGVVAVLVQYFIGPLITPGGFGLSRWLSGFVDIVSLPALVPLVVCLLLVALKVFPGNGVFDYAGFTLLWLIPLALPCLINGGYFPTPIPLILVPLLWIAQGLGIPFFINCITHKPRRRLIILLVFGIAALPIAATTSWWAFFSQRNILGGVLLALSFIPALITFINNRPHCESQNF